MNDSDLSFLVTLAAMLAFVAAVAVVALVLAPGLAEQMRRLVP